MFSLRGLPWFVLDRYYWTFQGDPLSVVILNCVLCPLLNKLFGIDDLTVYAFADDLTIIFSSWDVLYQAFGVLNLFCSTTDLMLNLSKCQLWNKRSPAGTYPSAVDQFSFCFFPFLLGSPIDIGVSYEHSLQKHDEFVLSRAKKIAKLPLPYQVAYRLFVSSVSSCYNHFALSYDIRPAQSNSLKHAITPSWSQSVVNGSAVKPSTHQSHLVTCYLHNYS